MDKDKLSEIKQLYKECKELNKMYIECHDDVVDMFLDYKKKHNNKLIKSSDTTISDLKLLLAYLKKHNELKMVYNSYKDILKMMLNYKKKLIYYSHLSKPLITDDQLKIMVRDQQEIMGTIEQLNKMLPKL